MKIQLSTDKIHRHGEEKDLSRNSCTHPSAKVFSEVVSFFSSPVWVLLIGLLCASWGFRTLPKVLADDRGDRNSTFQVLADGTQDLAALVGLFATDSVERYSVDYSRGYLSVAVATCSLLGIMGYVRALVKLAMGSESCQDSAFPTAPVRSILGVAESDRLPKEELFTVTYISRRTVGDSVEFRAVKRLNHTIESFPAARVFLYRELLDNYAPNRYRLMLFYNWLYKGNRGYITTLWGALLLTAAATSFPIIPVSSQSGWIWTRMIGSFGLFFALAISSTMWAYVYLKEQTPPFLANISYGLQDLHEFAIMHPAQQIHKQVLCDLQAVTGQFEWVCRVLSLLTAAMISLGYICQYVEIRKATTTQAAWWLGSQVTLALFRLIIWMWDPKFDDNTDFEVVGVPLRDTSNFKGQDFAITLFSEPLFPVQRVLLIKNILGARVAKGTRGALSFPSSFLNRLENEPIIPLLEQANDLVSNEITDSLRHELLNECIHTWEFPEALFGKWLAYRSGNIERISNSIYKHRCIIVNIGGSRPWVGGKIMLIPVICLSYDQAIVASTIYGSSGVALDYFSNGGTQKGVFTSRDVFGNDISTFNEDVANLLKELRATISYMKYGPVNEDPTDPNKEEVVIDMGSATSTPSIQTAPLPNVVARRATITSLPSPSSDSIQ